MDDNSNEKITVSLSYKSMVIFGLVIIGALIFAVGYLYYTNTQLTKKIEELEGNTRTKAVRNYNDDVECEDGEIEDDWEDTWEEDEYYDDSVYLEGIHDFDPTMYNKTVVDGETTYEPLKETWWWGDNQYEYIESLDKYIGDGFNYCEIVDYDKYISIINEINDCIKKSRKEVNPNNEPIELIEDYYQSYDEIKMGYLNHDSNYIIVSRAKLNEYNSLDIRDCFIDDGELVIIGNIDSSEDIDKEISGYFLAIPTDLPTTTKVKTVNIPYEGESYPYYEEIYVRDEDEDLEELPKEENRSRITKEAINKWVDSAKEFTTF
jgi:hypothetical protein